MNSQWRCAECGLPSGQRCPNCIEAQGTAIPTNESIEPSRRATFRAAAKGMRAYTIALRINGDRWATPDIDWRGCTKGHLEDEFATGKLSHLAGVELRRILNGINRPGRP